jgi:hypothetical protein
VNSNQSSTSSQFNTDSSLDLGDSDVQMPLGLTGETAEAPEFTGMSGKRKLSSGSILLIIVVVVAIAGLFSMRTIGKVTGAATGSTSLEDKINDFLKGIKAPEAGSKEARVVGTGKLDISKLGQDYTEHQVALGDVQKNPFILPTDGDSTTTTTTIAGGSGPDDVKRAELAALFQSVGNRLRLKSVILGSEPLANVSGRIVRLNETILIEPEKVEFLVAAIENETITLKGINAELKLEVEVTLQINRSE